MLLATIIKDEDALKLLSKNESHLVRALVAKNYEPKILGLLSDDESYEVRLEVAKHDIYENLLKLSKDHIFEVLEQVCKHNHKDVLLNVINHLPSINSEDVIEKHQPNYMQDYILSEIAKHGYEELSEKILDNEYHNCESMYEIAKHNHRNSHLRILNEILEENPLEYDSIILEIAKHDNKDVLNKIIDVAEKYPDYQDDPFFSPSLSIIANNKDKDILLRLSKFDKYDINKELLKSKDKKILNILSKSEDPEIRNLAIKYIKPKSKLTNK